VEECDYKGSKQERKGKILKVNQRAKRKWDGHDCDGWRMQKMMNGNCVACGSCMNRRFEGM
jgi:hypothetical protein